MLNAKVSCLLASVKGDIFGICYIENGMPMV